ncbi:tudor domain-containing 6-like [Trachinotus anak]|uniref:tudor domain-containing 6-like n=1 Tax=Trachinotus anak TaxID=443729 RepID=UPI0039F1CAC8
MCSIPGLPTPGSEVPVLITRVNLNPSYGFVELWVNMDDGRNYLHEQMREKTQIPERLFYGSEGKPGDLCLVCISDTWHRARIVSIQSETYNVFLIDQGQPLVTTSEALAWAHCDSFLFPPEIESCVLANVLSLDSNWPEKATKFLKALPGNRFKGLVQQVLMPDRTILLDIPIVSEHMCNFGVAKKIPEYEFKGLVLKRLHLPKGDAPEAQEQNLSVSCQIEKHEQYFYPELLTDMFETVNVTEVADPQNIFCKLHIFSKVLKKLSEEIHQHYEEDSDYGEVQPQTCGDTCAAKGMNGRWHRSLLKQNIGTEDCAVEVLHVDKGKTELVPVGDIRPLHGKFLRMPVVTYLCSLDGLQGNDTGWTADQTDYLKSLLLNQTVLARFDHYDTLAPQDVYYVKLYAANSECISDCFLEKVGVFPPSKTEQDSTVRNKSMPSSLRDKQCMDSQNKVDVSDDLKEQTLASTKSLEVDGRMDHGPSPSADDIPIKGHSEHPGPVVHNNGHLSTGFPSEVHHACDDDVITVGSIIDVKVSCIESLQKFWCQSTENGDSLRVLMHDLQNHYASAHPQPLVESICVARNPENNMWYRAKIIASHHSPVVDVRFIDYGQTRKVPLQDVRPIDPAFLRLNAQAFQCCLFNLKNSTKATAVTWTDAALAEFQKFVDLGATSNIGLKCVVKARTSDEEGLLLNVVDIETPSDSACKLLAEKCAQTEAYMQIPPQVPPDAYNSSTHNIEVGGKEKVWVTSSENISHFYCQLDRNSHLIDKVTENVKQLIGQPQCTDHPLGLNSICLVRYTNNQWHRGQIVEMPPTLKVHFVDYGDTLTVNESDIRSFPSEGSFTRSVPVQAVPLGLFDVPGEVPEEVNQWFADHAIGHSLTISVVAKGEKGKLIVELFDGSLNVNVKVREMISKMARQKKTGFIQQTDPPLSNSSERTSVPNEDCLTQELMNVSVLKLTEQKKVQSSDGTCARGELKMSSQSLTNVSTPEIEHGKTLDEGRQLTLDVIHEDKETRLAETFIQGDSEITQLSLLPCPEGNVNICMYKRPNICQNKTEEVYASCIVGPHYFWCQNTNTKDLNMMSVFAQEAGQAQQDTMFPETLGPGSPCLALFSSDNQWYRAQVIKRTDATLHVLFIDYGNESDVDINSVRSLPQSLLDKAPQAFLCSLNGFDESEGTWDDQVYEDFYNLLVDKPLRVTVFNVEDHSEIAVHQYAVEVECENMLVNNAMQKYWKPVATEHVAIESRQTEKSPGRIASNMTHFKVSKGNVNTSMYKKPKLSKNQMESVYASCIVEPGYFWCQYASTEELTKLSVFAQEAGQAQQDTMFPETLGPGSPCLALFSSDNQWYRAQVIKRTDNTVHVLFIDYGNESDVDINSVRSLPQSLLDKAPQAILCSLNGFDGSEGTWDDQVYEDFYNLLVDKPLRVTVFNVEDHSEITVPQYAVQVECENVLVNNAMQKYWKPVVTEHVTKEIPQTENSLQGGETASNTTHFNVSNGKANTSTYKKPKISKTQTESVYASCIVEPGYFWCQYASTEELTKLSAFAQEAGQAQQDTMFPETLGPGSPCLALFSSDNQWYRAQVIKRTDATLHVLFIDYGNESDVDINSVRSLPQSLLDKAPQAFLCSLNGFDGTEGTWDDQVYEDFYNLLVDKPLRVTVFNVEDHSEIAVPQYAVEVECEGVVVNTLMKKYWKGQDTDYALADCLDSANQGETRTADDSVGV